MTPRQILTWLACHDVLIASVGNDLHIEGPADVLTDKLFARIESRKSELVQELDDHGPGLPDVIPGDVPSLWPHDARKAWYEEREQWIDTHHNDRLAADRTAELVVRATRYQLCHPEFSVAEVILGLKAGTIPPKDHPLAKGPHHDP